VPFLYREPDGRELTIDPDRSETVVPLLGLLGRELRTIHVTRQGQLTAAFGDGSSLVVEPHPTYEAWEATGDGELEEMKYLCGSPGESPWG
jgi:hypothetical protein